MTEGKQARSMRSRFAAVFALLVFPLNPPLLAQAPAEKLDDLESIIVVGGYATPQMWKISKDGHVLWLLVIGGPAPAGVQWRTQELETRVAESQLVLLPSEAVGVGSTLSRSERVAGRRERNDAIQLPGKDALKDVLPRETYARWRVLKTAYLGSDDAIEHQCPSCALDELERRVMKTIPAPPKGPELQPLVVKAAKKYKVKVRTMPNVLHRFEITRAESEMASIESLLDQGDVKCFAQRLNYLERLIEFQDQRANVATQDDVTLPRRESCYSESDWPSRWVTSGKLPDPAAAQSVHEKASLAWEFARQQMDEEWMATAKAALAKNRSTLAVQRIAWSGYLSHVNGYIAQFRELGYEVEEPGDGGK